MAKEYVPIFFDWLYNTQDLEPEDKGKLIDAIVSYASGEDYEQFLTAGNKVAFRFLKGQVDRNNAISDVRSKARAKKDEETETNDNKTEQNGTNENKTEQTETNFPKEKEKEKEKENKKREREQIENLFDRFWSAYPRHEAKATARAEFDKLKPDEELLETMLAAIDKQKQSAQWQENGGQYIPHPRTWLHQRRWEDEVTENRPAGKTVIAQQYSQRDYSGEDEAAMQWMIDAIKAEKEQENEGRLQVL